MDQLYVWRKKNEASAEKNTLSTQLSRVVLSDARGLLCIWHWKPAVFGRQYGLIKVSGNPRRKRHVRKLKLRRHWTFQKDDDPAYLKFHQGSVAEEVQEHSTVAIAVT